MIRKITAKGIVARAMVGSTRWRQRVGRAVELAGQQPVEHEEAGDPGAAESGVLPAGHGEDRVSDGEPVLEEEGEEEHRHRDADERHHDRAVVERRAVSLRGQVAERDREHDRDEPSRRCSARSSRAAGSGRCRRRRARAAPTWRRRTRRGRPAGGTSGTARRPAGRGRTPRSEPRARLGVARSPRIAETTPPGRERSQKNSSRERTNTTPTIWIRRLMMNLANGGS